MVENIRTRLKIEFTKDCENDKIIQQQSELTFNGIHKSYTNYNSYTFEQNEVVMDNPILVGFATFEMSELHKYESYYDELQQNFGQKNFELHYMDTDSFVLSINTKDNIRDLKNLRYIFDFINPDENHEIFSKKKTKNYLVNSELKLLKIILIDEFICLGSKAYSVISNGENTNIIKRISKTFSKNNKFEE